MELKANTTLNNNRYSIAKCIGNGGFGITYLASDNKLGRQVVLKEYFPKYMATRENEVTKRVITISPNYEAELKEGIRKFLNEAKTLALLDKIHEIATIHDFFEENGTAYIVMEYIQGKNLKQVITERTTPFTFEEAINLIRPCLEALDKVHQSGLIHRDFTPDNIIINESGSPKIIDFGSSRDYISNEATMTIMVKHGYAPIEQYSGTVKQGTYTDVYSISAIIYEMLTLSKPAASIDRLRNDPVQPPSAFNNTVTPEQDAVVMKGLAVNYEDRYSTIKELIDALDLSGKSKTNLEKSKTEFHKTEGWMPGTQAPINVYAPETPQSQGIVPSENAYMGEATEFVNAGTVNVGNVNAEPAQEATEIVRNISENENKKSKKGIIIALASVFAVAFIGTAAFIVISNGSSKSYKEADNEEVSDDMESDSDSGAVYTEDGMVNGVKASKIVTLPSDYTSIVVPYSEIEYTEADFIQDKREALEEYQELSKFQNRYVKNGDKINLDYVGRVNGIEFEGGSTRGLGADLEIGSETYIPGFEEQLVGHKVGEIFDIEVTFPDNYPAPELAGRNATFKITINGVYEMSQFDNDFVRKHLSEYASTVEEYKAYMKEKREQEAKEKYITEYFNNSISLSKYPKRYLDLLINNERVTYESMSQLYGIPMDVSDAELESSCKTKEAEILARQAICELQGITASDSEITEYLKTDMGLADEASYNAHISMNGRGYAAQCVLQQKANQFLFDNAVIQ